jgi:hypothetical protein
MSTIFVVILALCIFIWPSIYWEYTNKNKKQVVNKTHYEFCPNCGVKL